MIPSFLQLCTVLFTVAMLCVSVYFLLGSDFEARHAGRWELHSELFQPVLPRGGVCGWGCYAELCFFRSSMVRGWRGGGCGDVRGVAANHRCQDGFAAQSDSNHRP